MHFVLLLQKFHVDIISSTRIVKCVFLLQVIIQCFTIFIQGKAIIITLWTERLFVNTRLMDCLLYSGKKIWKDLIRKSLSIVKLVRKKTWKINKKLESIEGQSFKVQNQEKNTLHCVRNGKIKILEYNGG